MKINAQEWRELSGLLDSALDMPASERRRWLDALPEKHAALKAPLEEMLGRQGVETADILARPPDVAAALFTRVPKPWGDVEPQIDGMIGAYRLMRELGRGGMGAVWLAERTDGKMRRQVAIKLPYAGPNQRQLAERLAHERDILASLEHPNIARLYDADVTPTGQPFLVLEYVDGVSIVEYCDRKRLSLRQRLILFMQVLKAVQHAHARLVIHRDLKPSNILVTQDGLVRLLDFGIAKLMLDGEAKESLLTRFGGRALTPDYASPEQISGQPITTASDVYSLGVVLYELLCGSSPYRLRRESHVALEDAIERADVVAPSRTAVDTTVAQNRSSSERQLARALRGDLDSIVLNLLKKSATDRYQSCDAVAQDIACYLDGRSVSARPDSAWYRLRNFVARQKVAVTSAVVIAIALIAGAALALWQARAAQLERDRAVALAERNEAVNEFLNSLMTNIAGSDKPISAGEMLARSENLVDIDYSGNPEHQAAVLAALSSQYQSMGNPGKAEPLIRRAISIAEHSGDVGLRAKLRCDRAIILAQTGKADEAKLEIDAVVGNPPLVSDYSAECLGYRSTIAGFENNGSEALKFGTLALQHLRDRKHRPPTLEATFLGIVGFGNYLNGRIAEADRYYQEAMQILTVAKRERSQVSVTIRNNWAVISDGAGDPKRALELQNEVLGILSQLDPGGEPPPYLLANRSRALEWLGRYRESLDEYRHCVKVSEQLGSGAAQTYCLLGIASANRELGNLKEAEAYLEKAQTSAGDSITRGSPADLSRRIVAARLAQSLGRLDAARNGFTEVIDAGRQNSAVVSALLGRAEVALAEHQSAAAIDDAQKALTLSEKMQGGKPYSNRTGLAWWVLARAADQQHRNAEALEAGAKAVEHLEQIVDSTHPSLVAAKGFLQSRQASSRNR